MAKSTIKNLDKLLKQMHEAISKFDQKFYLGLAEYVSKRIVQKARTGKTMISGEEAPLKALSGEYVDFRQRVNHGIKTGTKRAVKKKGLNSFDVDRKAIGKATKGKANVDSRFFSPKRSNLTFTGQYLASIRTTKVDPSSRLMVIEPTDTTPRKKGPDWLKLKASKPVTNKDIAKYQAKQGRNIFGLDSKGRESLKQMVLREIRKQIRNRVLRK